MNGVLLSMTLSRASARMSAKIRRGVWSMSRADGQDPPQVPHWIHVSNFESVGIAAMTSSLKVGARTPPETTGGGGTAACGIFFRLSCSNARGRLRDGDRGGQIRQRSVGHGPRLGSSGRQGDQPPEARAIRLSTSVIPARSLQTEPTGPLQVRRFA